METSIEGRHSRYIEIATKLAESVEFNHRHGTVVVSGGRILGKGRNCYKTGMHAECSALSSNWRSEFSGAIIYIVRLRKSQRYGLSLPCPKCMAKIKACGISKICYSTNDPNKPFVIEKV
jgi:pyrimidine deaminase RibD-like protein